MIKKLIQQTLTIFKSLRFIILYLDVFFYEIQANECNSLLKENNYYRPWTPRHLIKKSQISLSSASRPTIKDGMREVSFCDKA